MSLDAGSVVSHYRIVRRLGAGGMGEVFLAQDLQLDRRVAIKFLREPEDPQSRKRLVQEARAAASLDHPNICAVYEVSADRAEGDFIVMQYVEGEPLSSRLQRGRIAPTDAIAICRRIAEALRQAHRQGIVHRDLKPHNIIITPSGDPKLLDFGIAKRLVSGSEAAEADTTSPATSPHAQVGTPAYMSPEQVRSQPADFRSDLFAFGCVLYECLTGRRAFTGLTTAEIFGQILHVDPQPVSIVAPEVGTAYDAICARLLQKDPRERFQSADEVLGALLALTPTTSSAVRTATSSRSITLPIAPRSRVGKIVLAAAIVIVAAGIFALFRLRSSLPEPPANARQWYDRGVEALRQGTYVAAKSALEEAIRKFDSYPQAHSRLAEAYTELDDPQRATTELLTVNKLVPNESRLRKDDRLRLEAVRDAVLRDYDKAVDEYRQLLAMNPKDEGAWVDLGRAHEARADTTAAKEAYRQAAKLNPEYAPAHVRLAASPGTPIKDAVAGFDEAIRIYRLAANVEGEIEALIRKGIAQNTVGQVQPARQTLERAIAMTTDAQYRSQQLRAKFELVSVTVAEGHLAQAVDDARQAADAAVADGLQTIAANGLVDLGTALAFSRQYADADAQLTKAIQIASDQGAKRTEMRARLQQASIRLPMGKPDEALKLASPLLTFYTDDRYPRNAAQAKTILSRAHAALGEYDDARALTTDVLALANKLGDKRLLANSLDDTRSLFSSKGNLPEALKYLEQVEPIHRELRDQSGLAFDLTNHAELLIQLGRGSEAAPLFAEIDDGARNKIQSFISRAQRVAFLHMLQESIQQSFAEALKFADVAVGPSTDKPNGTTLFAMVLREHARAQLGQSRVAPNVIASWIDETTLPMFRGDLSYWIALTLLSKQQPAMAKDVLDRAAAITIVTQNVELEWRLAAVTAMIQRALAKGPEDASISARVDGAVRQLRAAWTTHADSYFARPDLKALLRRVLPTAPSAQAGS